MPTHPLDYPTASGETVGALMLAPIVEAGLTPTVVDVGARNGMMLLPASLARHCKNVGFEPNEEEYRKLVEGRTDAAQFGLKPPPFKETQMFDCALWDREEERPLFITVGAGSVTLMGATRPAVTDHLFLGGVDAPAFDAKFTSVKRTETVKCRPLDDLLPTETVDFLKIDAEGAELNILRGARRLLARHDALLIKTEVFLVPYYEDHPLLGHQHVFLSELGYRLIDLEFAHQGYSRYRTPIDPAADRRLIYAGDAYFMPDPDLVAADSLRWQRTAVMAASFGFHSLAISLLRDAALVPIARIDEIETALGRVPARRRLRLAWNRLPYTVWDGIRRLGRRR